MVEVGQGGLAASRRGRWATDWAWAYRAYRSLILSETTSIRDPLQSDLAAAAVRSILLLIATESPFVARITHTIHFESQEHRNPRFVATTRS